MNESKLTPAQLEALLNYAGNKLGIPPQQLVNTVNKDLKETLASKLSPDDAAKFQALVGDKDKLAQMLNSPKAQELINKITGNAD